MDPHIITEHQKKVMIEPKIIVNGVDYVETINWIISGLFGLIWGLFGFNIYSYIRKLCLLKLRKLT